MQPQELSCTSCTSSLIDSAAANPYNVEVVPMKEKKRGVLAGGGVGIGGRLHLVPDRAALYAIDIGAILVTFEGKVPAAPRAGPGLQ